VWADTNPYFQACMYASEILGDAASRRFPDLLRLAESHDLAYLRRSVDSWTPQTQTVAPVVPDWHVGMTWGDFTLRKHVKGIVWDCRCSCGKMVKKVSCNYTTPDALRKCDTCQLSDSLKEGQLAIVKGLTEIAARVLELHRNHDKIVWHKVRNGLKRYGIPYKDELGRDLHAMAWVRISEKLAGYQDQGFKITTWLGAVVDTTVREFMKTKAVHNRLAPMVPLDTENDHDHNRELMDNLNSPSSLPARPVRLKGAEPDTQLTKDPVNGETVTGVLLDL
jgi:hypothetical protein